jgi:hypothetical protein
MTQALDTFNTLVVHDRDGYGAFETTEAGEPYHDALWSFCVGDSSLHIPELGISFVVRGSRKENVDLCESKLQYDLVVEFCDQNTGKSYVLSTAIYKAIDRLYGAMDIAEVEPEADEPENTEPEATLPAEQAQVLVDKIGSYFEDCGRELVVSTDDAEGNALSDLMCSPYVGDSLDIGGYQFRVTATDEEVTDESDAWSLGAGSIELTEVDKGFKVHINTSLFLGQSTEITGVCIECSGASFDKDAED